MLMRELRKAFLTGLFLCLPLAITLYVVKFLVDLAATPSKGIVLSVFSRYFNMGEDLAKNFWVQQSVILISALMVVVGFTVVGWLSRYFLGRFLIDMLEGIIGRVPMIKSVYTSIKQIVATFGAKNKANFKQVVL
ncbi:MAG: DUF502 domain-containing protein, partial [Puniceicoccales bacterium]|nr:DUF502 domain-containing protein [Puniceicoccales bacterium]